MNIFVACKFPFGSDNSHIFGLTVVNSRSAALIAQNISPLFDLSLRVKK